MSEIEIEIDGQKLKAQPNQTVIQVADEAGIYIPRFCYHKALSIAANCRMCLVEIEKSPKAMPACATPVMPGMKVFTKSPATIAAQRAVMEFLLINHPLDCPICDQGGECELQDLAMGYGSPDSCYTETKRAVKDKNLGPLIATEMTRCIHCTRCVRFGDEIAGLREMGVTFRGEHAEIGTYVEQAIQSEVSGNIIDICPVGALTSKPYRFTARAWEMKQAESISPHDAIGSHLNIHTRNGRVMRVVAKNNPAINEEWISDRDRFSYEGLYHADRLEQPMVKLDGQWETVDWEKAMQMAATAINKVVIEQGADQLAALASPNSTTEEFYLLQKILRSLGSENIDHRLRDRDFSDQSALGLGMSLTEFESADSFLLLGSNLQKEQPLLALRLRKALSKGAVVTAINPVDYTFNFNLSARKIVAPHECVRALAGLVKALDPSNLEFQTVMVDDALRSIAEHLRREKPVILLGALALHHPEAACIRYLASLIAELTKAKIGYLTDGANKAGAQLANALPERQGLNAYQLVEKPCQAYVLLNVEPDLDCANPLLAVNALKQAKSVIALTMYKNPVLEAHATIMLPITPFTETSGTFVNAALDWQSFQGVAQPYQSSRPAWKVLRVLGNFLKLDGFDYGSSEAVRDELKSVIKKPLPIKPVKPNDFSIEVKASLTRIGEIPIYAVDSLVRRSQPLQEAQSIMEGELAVVRIHPKTAEKWGLKDGHLATVKQVQGEAVLPVKYDVRIALDAVWIAGGIKETSGLGDLFGDVEVFV